ncbi:MAG: N-acetyl-gamma-glutamyl-phosphate reductase [Clostridiales bacterium]|nr:N-acetyl-gamma-glutamyl-phosphate reductase [Clostridiales bacterium]
MYKAFIDGAAGTTGLRIKDRLLQRRDIELLSIAEDKRKDENEIKRLMNESDVTFLCLPDEAAVNAVKLLDKDNRHTVIIDASTAHRTDAGWAYGFPELSSEHKKRIKSSRLIANPGCYASGFIAIAYPLAANEIISKSACLNAFALSGYSGAGKKAIEQYESPGRSVELDSPRMYALGQSHKHIPEIQAVCSLENAPVFIPVICPHKCGMIVSITLFAKDLKTKLSPVQMSEFYKEYYSAAPLIKTRPFGHTKNMLGANAFDGRDDMEIEVFGNGERMVITARFDNLGKGASGAAVQCMNLALGANEYESLVTGE